MTEEDRTFPLFVHINLNVSVGRDRQANQPVDG